MIKGRISPHRAAQLLDVHTRTVLEWAARCVAGEPAKLRTAVRHPLTGRYSIEYTEVMALREQCLDSMRGADATGHTRQS
jgi:hypothetical protein